MLSRQILKLKLDINIKTMFTYFLFAKDALAGSKTYILSQNQKPDPSCQVELSRGARAWLAVVAFHILFLVLNLYVFAKLAEETELSMFARKRRLWIDFVKPRTVSETKCFISSKPQHQSKRMQDHCLNQANCSSLCSQLFTFSFSSSTFIILCQNQSKAIK